MSAMVAEAVDLLQKADDYDIKFVIEYLKQDNNDIDTKKAALNRLVSMRKNKNLISNDYKEEYHNYLDERYIVTRNIGDFIKSKVKAILPKDMIKLIV